MAKKIKKNYKVNDKKKEIIIRSLSDLNQKEKDEVKFLVECGYSLTITNEAKPKTEPKPGNTKAELAYYLEIEADKEVQDTFRKIVKDENNYMAGWQYFKRWFKDNKAKPDPDDNTKKLPYNGEAAELIKKNKAQDRVAALKKELEVKKEK